MLEVLSVFGVGRRERMNERTLSGHGTPNDMLLKGELWVVDD